MSLLSASRASVSNNSKREVSAESDGVKVRDTTFSHLKRAQEWCKSRDCTKTQLHLAFTRICYLGSEYRVLVNNWPIESISPKKGDIVRSRA
jgi:hypothetical protein